MSSDDEDAPKNMRFSAARDFDNLTEAGGEFYGARACEEIGITRKITHLFKMWPHRAFKTMQAHKSKADA